MAYNNLHSGGEEFNASHLHTVEVKSLHTYRYGLLHLRIIAMRGLV